MDPDRLDGGVDLGEDGADLGAEEEEDGDHHDGHQEDDERVLNESLPQLRVLQA